MYLLDKINDYLLFFNLKGLIISMDHNLFGSDQKNKIQNFLLNIRTEFFIYTYLTTTHSREIDNEENFITRRNYQTENYDT